MCSSDLCRKRTSIQSGAEWIEVRLRQPADIGRLELVGAARTVHDYPRNLMIVSTDPDGVDRTLFDGSVIDRYIEAIVADERHPSLPIELPPNKTITLRIRQTGKGIGWWSIHELKLWERP